MRNHRGIIACAALAVLPACAAHTSHRVCIAPHDEVMALVAQAFEAANTARGAPLPGPAVVDVVIEPVDVKWVMLEEPLDTTGVPVGEIRPYVLDEAGKWVGDVTPEGALYRIEVELALDLHEPDELGLQVVCTTPDQFGDGLVRGVSQHLVVPRLYCHGCNERSGDKGTRLGVLAAGGAGYWDGYFVAPYYHHSGGGYIKH